MYYHNFPFEIKSTTEIDSSIIEATRLNRTEVPSIVYIGHGDTLSFEAIRSHPRKDLLKTTGVEIFLFEWFRYYRIGDSNKLTSFNELEFTNENHLNLRNLILDKADQFAREENVKVTVNCCEYNVTNYITNNYKNLKLQCLDFQNQTESFSYNFNSVPFDYKTEIKYKFFSSTNRFTNHRHLLMCYIADKGGKYSWPFYCNNLCQDIQWLDSLPWDYLTNGNNLLNQSNFFIDTEIDKIIIDDYKNSKNANFPWTWDGNLENFLKSFKDCFLALVSESVFFQPTATVTEKTFNSMFTLTPFIMIGAPFTLKYLKELGFKTFDSWWDESYDTETNHASRLLKIFKLIDYINSMSEDQLYKIYLEMKDVLNWNRNHLLTFHSTDIILP